jgi:hypothetical protein
MTDVDPQIGAILDGLVPAPDEAGKWERVLGDARAIERPRSHLRSSRPLVLASAVLAALAAAALAFVPALAGQGYFWFLDAGGPQPTTPVVTVTSITDRSDTTWELTAYRDNRGLCFQLTSRAKTGGGMGACASDMPLNAGVFGAGAGNGAFVVGPVTSDAQNVEITGSGQHVEATAVPAPEALQTDIKFYVAQLPEGMAAAPLMLKALDDQGDVVATWAVPGRQTP